MRESVKMPDEEYFAIDAASASLLKRIDCPAKALIPFRPTPAMMLGTLVHCAVLEPDCFDDRYVVAPQINRRTKAGKEEYAAFIEANADKTVISVEDYDTAHFIARCVRAHSVASDLLTSGHAERVFQWVDDRTGVDCKAKADYVNGEIIVDLKTTADASPGGFSRQCANLGYHIQEAHYTNGSECDQFIFVVIETSYPFVVEVYELDSEAKRIGRNRARIALDRYAEIKMFDLWDTNYTGEEKITMLSLPAWV